MGSVAVETAAADELVALAEPTAAVHNADEMDTDAVVQVGLNVGGQGHAAGGGRSGLLQFVPLPMSFVRCLMTSSASTILPSCTVVPLCIMACSSHSLFHSLFH